MVARMARLAGEKLRACRLPPTARNTSIGYLIIIAAEGGRDMATGPSGVAALETQKPSLVRGDILHAYYGGEADDLLTGGLGRSGFAELTVQNMLGFADAVRPTPSELRRIANSHLA